MNAERMNKANATAKIEGSQEARPPGGFPLASAPKKIFICSPYQSTANDPPCRKAQMEANIQRAKTACRILATMGVLPLAPHLYFTQFLKDEDAQERATGIRFGMEWLEAADEVWVFGETIPSLRETQISNRAGGCQSVLRLFTSNRGEIFERNADRY